MVAVADFLVVGAVIATILFAFVVLPELLERRGVPWSSPRTRLVVWAVFLGILLVPAALTGFLFALTVGDGVLLAAALVVAVLYDFFRLNPDRIPWRRR